MQAFAKPSLMQDECSQIFLFCISQPRQFGAAVFGMDDVYNKLKAFHRQATEHSVQAVSQKLYMVSVDVKSCFDTINVESLMNILKASTYYVHIFS